MENPRSLLIYFSLFLSSCSLFDDEPEIITKNCEAFDFSLPESEWIILPEGKDFIFEGEGKSIFFASEYSASDAYTIEYESAGLRALIPIGLPNRDCFASYNSWHNSVENETGVFTGEIGISFQILVENNGEGVFMGMGIDDVFFDMKIVNDTIAIEGGSFSGENFEPFIYENFLNFSFLGRNYQNVVVVINQNPELQPQEVYLSKNFGLFAFQKNDTLWIRN